LLFFAFPSNNFYGHFAKMQRAVDKSCFVNCTFLLVVNVLRVVLLLLFIRFCLLVSLLSLCFLYNLGSLITELPETLNDVLGIGLVGIVGDGDALLGDVAVNQLDAFLETEIAFNLVLAAGTVHLWLSGDNDGLNIFGHANHCGQYHSA
jgi:hypothetical protein